MISCYLTLTHNGNQALENKNDDDDDDNNNNNNNNNDDDDNNNLTYLIPVETLLYIIFEGIYINVSYQ